MAERFWIVETRIEHEEDVYALIGYTDVAEDRPSLTVRLELHDQNKPRDRPFAFASASFSVENPLVSETILVGAATAYGWCIARNGLKFTWKAVRQCYRDSQAHNPDADAMRRAREIAECLTHQREAATDVLSKALLDCIPFRKLFSGDDGDDDAEP